MPLFLGFLKILREKNKIYSGAEVLEELFEDIIYMVIKKFENKLTALREFLEHKSKIQEINFQFSIFYFLNFKKEEQIKKELNALKTKKMKN